VFIFVLYRLQPRIRDLDGTRVALASYAAPVEEVMTLLDRADKPYTRSGTEPVDRLDEPIRFERVSFRYEPDDPPALRDVTVAILPGQTTALVGPSGAGKSTFIKLLLRLYDPTEGTIYVNAHPLQSLDLTAWRRRLAVVGQDGYVFNTSVQANIAYGRLDATDAEIRDAARRADAHSFIQNLPRGYATRVGERGVRLSGGQRQRLTLARALVRHADLLILDEATNALDSLSEDIIQDTLETLHGRCTTVVIAHRLSTVMQADHVIVFDEGVIREQGTPTGLLEQEGFFTELYASQLQPATK
jgi:subfamily B ATP-binding cassette protein MsbA